jgi:hypothetical protein
VKIVNLGLEPEEGRGMGLEVEDVRYKNVQPVADYLDAREREWLQSHRIELNAMTTPRFLEWLDSKFAACEKLVPPDEVMLSLLEVRVRKGLEARITSRVLMLAGIDDLVKKAMEERREQIASLADSIQDRVSRELADDPTLHWREPVQWIAHEVMG